MYQRHGHSLLLAGWSTNPMNDAVTGIVNMVPMRNEFQFFVVEKGVEDVVESVIVRCDGGVKVLFTLFVVVRIGEVSRRRAYAGDFRRSYFFRSITFSFE